MSWVKAAGKDQQVDTRLHRSFDHQQSLVPLLGYVTSSSEPEMFTCPALET